MLYSIFIILLIMFSKCILNKSFIINKLNDKLFKLSNIQLNVQSCPIDNTKQTNNEIKKSICIVGGGFAGLYTALKLQSLDRNKNQLDITLIDKKDKFVFLPLLYELALGFASVSEVAPLYSSILKDSKIKFIKSNVDSIDFETNIVISTNDNQIKEQISYDYLVISPGAQPRLDIIEGAKEFAIPFYLSENAYALKTKIKNLLASDKKFIRIAVIGGGYSGVEVATNVAEYLGQERGIVTLIDRNKRVMNNSPDYNRNVAEKRLDSSGVTVLCNMSVKQITNDRVILNDNLNKNDNNNIDIDIPADYVIVTSGTQPSQLVNKLSTSLLIDENGRILVNKNLKVIDKLNVYAAGDCSRVDGVLLPSTAQVAIQQSDILSNNIYKQISNNNKLDEFNYLPLGEMLTLGFKDAAITGLGGLVEIDGPLAALARRVVYAARMPTPTQTVNALVNAGISTASNILLNLSKKYDKNK